MKTGGAHMSRADFTQRTPSIELEADHFASGLLMPSHLVRDHLASRPVGMDAILYLAETACCSITAAAIRAAECSPRPMAIVVSRDDEVAYAFMSETFKNLGRLAFLRKGMALPLTATRKFNADPANVLDRERTVGETDLATWFDGPTRSPSMKRSSVSANTDTHLQYCRATRCPTTRPRKMTKT